MVHTPLLSTDLFTDLRARRFLAQTSAPKPFNLFKFLFLKGEFEKLIEIYEAFYGTGDEEEEPKEALASSKRSGRKRSGAHRKEDRAAELRATYAGLIDQDVEAENEYWVGFGYSALKRPEAVAFLERSLTAGFLPAAALLANYALEDKEIARAEELLDLLKPFDKLESWHQAIAYREHGKLLEDVGRFDDAQTSYQTSWDISQRLPDGQLLLGLAGQLLGWILELFSLSQDALHVVRQAKQNARANRRVQLLYLQVLAAAHVKNFDEAQAVLEELETFVPNDPYLQGLAFQASGVLARLQGNWMTAIEDFENAAVSASGARTEAAIGANLFASHASLALGDKDGAIAYLEQAENEFFSLDPFLAPTYSFRAQAGLSLRRGAIDVALKKPTTIDHLENARQIYAELGLPLGQCQCLLHLAGWYANEGDLEKAMELLKESEALRKTFQDIASYEVELVLLPQLEPLLKELRGE